MKSAGLFHIRFGEGSMPNSIHLIRFLGVVVALIALTCLGCSEVAPTNPFDPETPVALLGLNKKTKG